MRVSGGFGLCQKLMALHIACQNSVQQTLGAAGCFLRHCADAGVAGHACGAGLGDKFSQHDFEQCGFANAVPAHQSGAVACGYGNARIFEQNATADAVSESLNL